MSKPEEYISRSGQLWKLVDNEYVLDTQSPRLVYGSLQDHGCHLTQSGELYIDNHLIEGINERIIQYILTQLYELLILTEEGHLCRSVLGGKEFRLIGSNIKMIVDSGINDDQEYNDYGIAILQYFSGQWTSLTYSQGNYCYHDLPYDADINQSVPGDEAVSLGRIVTSDGDIFQVEDSGHAHDFGYFSRIDTDIRFHIACMLGVTQDYQQPPIRIFAGVSEDGQLYIFDEDRTTNLLPERSDYLWNEILLVDGNYYAINEINEIFHINIGRNIRNLIKIDIPPYVINGVNKVKNSRTRI